jgi:hypothetical protein
VFEFLQGFDKIIVTGPHRSGTTIAMRMIARDFNYDSFYEECVEYDNLGMAATFMIERSKFVLQIPGLCRWVHLLGNRDDTAVVMMKRNVDDILSSERRVNWQHRLLELWKYDMVDGIVPEIKYKFWDEYQKKILPHPFEINYEDLREHPLWISYRPNFGIRQTI